MSATDHTAQRAGLPPLVPVILFGTAGLAWMWRLAATSVGSDGDRWLVVLAGLAGLAAFLASAKRPRRQAVPWLALAIGCTTWGASHPVRFDAPLSQAVLFSAAYLSMAIAFSLALVVMLGIAPDRDGIAKLLIDMIPPVIAVATATWLFMIGPFVVDSASGTVARVTATVHGVSGASLLVIAVGSVLSRHRKAATLDGQLLLTGVCVVAIADMLRIQQSIGSLPDDGAAASLTFAAGFVCLIVAAAVSKLAGSGHEPAATDRAIAPWESQVPNLSLVAILLLGIGQAALGETVRYGLLVTLGGALVMLLLVIARQSIVLRRDRHLRTEIGELSERIDGLMLQVGRDPLTGLLNHRAVHERLDHELASGRVNGQPVAVVLIDVDNFKTVNDTLGHQAGDRVLRAIAGILTAACRGSDVAARYAGDEFMLLLPGLDEAHAGGVCNRIAEEVRRVNRDLRLGDVRVSLSVGVAVTHRCQRSVAQTVAIADAAMYDAKETGKDQVVVVNADTLVIAELHDGDRPVDAMVAASRAAVEASIQIERRRAS